jgi:hypothetical protein
LTLLAAGLSLLPPSAITRLSLAGAPTDPGLVPLPPRLALLPTTTTQQTSPAAYGTQTVIGAITNTSSIDGD